MIKPRTRSLTIGLLLLITVFLHCAAVTPLIAQTARDGQIVTRVEILGLKPSDAAQARSLISTAAGRPFDQKIARQDQKRLAESGLFDDIAIVSKPDGEDVIISFILKHRSDITAIEFIGNSHFTDRKLLNGVDFSVGDPLDIIAASSVISDIQDNYKSDGYYFARVTLDKDRIAKKNALIYTISEGPRVRLRDVDFEFVGGKGAFSKIKLSSMIKSGDGWWIIVPGRLSEEKIEEDISKLETFYHEKGYLDAEITTRLDFTPDKTKAELKFVIDQGQRYRVEKILLSGNRVFGNADLVAKLDMTRGKFFNEQAMQLDAKNLKDAYGRIGFVHAQITPRIVYSDPARPAPADLKGENGKAPALVSVVYDVHEGSQYKLGRIEIRGNDVSKDRIIRRLINMHSGDLFDSTAMELSEKNLQQCGLFSKATIIPYGRNDEFRDALVEIEEGNTASINVGLSASSDTGLSGMLSYRQTNFSLTRLPKSFKDAFIGSGFKGDGQTLEFRIEPGVEYSRLRVSWHEPYLMDRNVSLSVGGYAERLDQDDFDQDQNGIDVGMGRALGGLWYGTINTGLENVKIRDIEDDSPPEIQDELGSSMFGSIGASLVRDGTDSRWLPASGGKFTLAATFTGLDYEFLKTRAEYKHYFTTHTDVLDRKHILALRGRMDCMFGEAPTYKRYYGGGLSHVRGFEYRGISPRAEDVTTYHKDTDTTTVTKYDDPVGGYMLSYLGAEYSVPLVGETVRGIAFLDSGTVESERRISSWRVSTGLGVSIKMGNIPVIINFAWPLKKEEEDDEEFVSFSMGWFF